LSRISFGRFPGNCWRCWIQLARARDEPSATFEVDQAAAWKLFTKRMDRQTALSRFPDDAIGGDRDLGSRVLDMVSVMA
jgi:hypothetical protein